MENFSLADLAWIVGGVVTFAAACFVMPPLFRYGPKIIVSLFHRYMTVDFDSIMSRIADLGGSGEMGSTSHGGSGGSGMVVPQHWHQAEPDFDTDSEAERESFVLRQLTRNELIVMLATQKKDNGGYLFSSNQIKDFVGGRAADVGQTIAAVRGKKEAPKPARSIRRISKDDWEPVR